MAVLIPDCVMAVGRATQGRGAFGDTVTTGPTDAAGPALPAAKRENGDGTWRINVDPSLWPVRVNDRLIDGDTGDEYVVTAAEHITHPEAPEISHVRCAAVQVAVAGVEPGGVEFAGRQ